MATIKMIEKVGPSTPASGYTELYINVVDGNITQKDDAGVIINLVTKEEL